MLKIIMISFSFYFISSVSAQGIKFDHNTWEEVKAKAKKQNKPIFVDTYTSWCGPCKKLTKHVFPLEEVGDHFNANFISIKIDMETEEGIPFGEKYEVKSLPTLLFFSPNGELLHKSSGYKDAKELIILGKDALNPEIQLARFAKQYDAGNRSPKFVTRYILELQKEGVTSNNVFNNYWDSLSLDKKLTKTSFDILDLAIDRFLNEKAVVFFLEHKEEYQKIVTSEMVDNLTEQILIDKIIQLAIILQLTQKKELDKALEKVKKLKDLFPTRASEIDYYLESFKVKNKAKRLNVVQEIVNITPSASSISFFVKRHCIQSKNKKILNLGLSWIEQSIKLDKRASNLSLKAQLLYKLNRYEESKRCIEQSIEITKSQKKAPSADQQKLLKLYK